MVIRNFISWKPFYWCLLLYYKKIFILHECVIKCNKISSYSKIFVYKKIILYYQQIPIKINNGFIINSERHLTEKFINRRFS